MKMSKHCHSSDITKYVVCGVVLGSAVGGALTVMMRQKRNHPTSMMRQKAAAALDTMSSIMQNVADFTR